MNPPQPEDSAEPAEGAGAQTSNSDARQSA
jgi:hypothetical protein